MDALRLQTLHDYSAGRIGWREACSRLGHWDVGDLYAEMQAHGIAHYVPDEATAKANAMRFVGVVDAMVTPKEQP